MWDQLISEHRVAISIARELADSQPGEDRDSWLRDLNDLIAEHLEAEERFVGPLLDQYPHEGIGPPLDLRAAQLGSALVAVRDTGDGFGPASVTLMAALQTHVAYVEYDVIPALAGPAGPDPQLVAGNANLGGRTSTYDAGSSEPPFWEQ